MKLKNFVISINVLFFVCLYLVILSSIEVYIGEFTKGVTVGYLIGCGMCFFFFLWFIFPEEIERQEKELEVGGLTIRGIENATISTVKFARDFLIVIWNDKIYIVFLILVFSNVILGAITKQILFLIIATGIGICWVIRETYAMSRPKEKREGKM